MDNNVNIYSETMSNYDEIDDGDLFPVNEGNNNTVKGVNKQD